MASTTSAPFSFSFASPPASSQTNKSPSKTKDLVNPLLSRNGASLPFKQALGDNAAAASQRNNDGLRQRRKGNEERDKDARKVFPPKVSLTTGGGFAGVLDDGDKVMGSESDIHASWRSSESAETDESFDRYVVVYGYATSAQYDAILRRFESFGKIVNRRGVCRPGMSNWVALQYESSLQAEKALSQQNSMIMDGILVGVMRMSASLKESLEWNSVAPPLASPLSGVSPPGKQRLDGAFRDSVAQSRELREEDVLLVNRDVGLHATRGGGTKNICERLISWMYGWDNSASGAVGR